MSAPSYPPPFSEEKMRQVVVSHLEPRGISFVLLGWQWSGDAWIMALNDLEMPGEMDVMTFRCVIEGMARELRSLAFPNRTAWN